jgi:hypothetical protein
MVVGLAGVLGLKRAPTAVARTMKSVWQVPLAGILSEFGRCSGCRAGGFDGLQISRNGLRGGYPRFLNCSFSGFIHFPKKRTLTGWALLFAMGKVTSKDFLYGREHVRVWKCRKTRTKVRSKSGQKWVSRVQSRWVQNDEMSILPGSMVGQQRAKKVKNESKNDPKMMGK